jgi:hypothetical protein
MSKKRWFLTAPTYAIVNFDAIRSAAIAAKVSLVDISLKLDDETAAAGMPAIELDPAYQENIHKSTALAPTYAEISEVRSRIQSHLAYENQLLVEAGQPSVPMPTSAELQALAVKVIKDKIANSGTVNPARAMLDDPEMASSPSTEPQLGEGTGTGEGEGEGEGA